MWWAVYLILCGVLAAATRGAGRSALLLIICGLLAVQIFKIIPLGEFTWVAFAATWVCIAGLILKSDASSRHVGTICALTLISATCYPIGRLGGFAFAPGSPFYVSPLFWADMALISAILVAGGPGLARIADSVGKFWMGLAAGRGSAVSAGRGVALAAQAKEGPRK